VAVVPGKGVAPARDDPGRDRFPPGTPVGRRAGRRSAALATAAAVVREVVGVSFVSALHRVSRAGRETRDMNGKTGQPSMLPDLSGLTVLVVDDDEDAIEVLTTMINACGAEVLFARSASDGLAYIDATPHLDVVVTDISMPRIDGYEFTRKIREHPSAARRSVPVIALTGFQQRYVITETFDAFMQKPVDLDRLCSVIQVLLTKRRRASL